MSGGYWNYDNDMMRYRLFEKSEYNEETRDWETTPDPDPLEEPFLSELLDDMFQLIHACDWYKSGDTGEETYAEQKNTFFTKWQAKFAEQERLTNR